MRKYFILNLLLVFCLFAESQTISLESAKAKALHLRNGNRDAGAVASAGTPNSTIALAHTSEIDSTPVYYVFNYANGGFAIIGGDERAREVLGYSESGKFNIDSIPDGLRYMLQCYTEQINDAIKKDISPAASTEKSTASAKSSISPLLTTRWNQNYPYNSQILVYQNSRFVTGCVATATAQIMKYYNSPVKGTGSRNWTINYTYYGESVTFSADFENTTYDWDNMLDSYSVPYTSTQSEAVGTLMYHVGVAVGMIYGWSASSAYSYNVGSGLVKYFGYNPNYKYSSRSSYTDSEWDNLIYNELKSNRPVYYSGCDPDEDSGHAFVCDGYDATLDYYHFNWGWGGYCDGYYPISGTGALQPNGNGIGGSGIGSAYTSQQYIYTELYPASSTVNVSSISLNRSSLSLNVGDTSTLTATITPSNATNKNVTWSSSNTSVATVSASGVVTAKAAGSATITCTAADGSGKSATCSISVTTPLNLSGRSNVVSSNTAGATVSFSTSGTYEWEWDSSNSRMRSTNYNIGSTTSQTSVTITATKSTDLSFAYAVSSESGYDKLTITLDGNTIANAISGTTSTTYSGILTTGSHTLVLKYTKDGSENSGDDRAYISNMQLKPSTVLVTGISLSSTSASLTVGDTKTLTTTITPSNATNKNVAWSSSNTSVATVSTSGVVTAKAAGSATITCTAADGSGKSATCSITVTTPLNLSGRSNVVSSNTAGATVSFSTSGTYEWEWDSSNSRMRSTNYNIASTTSQTTVTITAMKSTDLSFVYAVSSESGCDKLTITLDGSTIVNAVGGVSSSTYSGTLSSGSHTMVLKYSKDGTINSGDDRAYISNMQLKPSTVLVTGISLSSTSASLTVGDTKTLTTTITPSNATNKNVTWSSSNTSVATVSMSGVVTAKAAGSATITCTAADGSGKSATCSITVTPATIEGDANGDGDVDVSDVALAVEYILGHDPSGFTLAAADLDNDGVIDVADVAMMINIIMYGNPSGLAHSSKVKNVSERTPYVCLNAHDDILNLWLSNTSEALSSIQFDLALPQGVDVREVLTSNFMNQHIVSSSLMENGMTRVICISLNNSLLSPDENGILSFMLTDRIDSLEYLEIKNIFAATPNGAKKHLQDVSMLDATAIAHAANDQTTKDIYSLGGQKRKSIQKGVNIVKQPNGSYKKVILKK